MTKLIAALPDWRLVESADCLVRLRWPVSGSAFAPKYSEIIARFVIGFQHMDLQNSPERLAVETWLHQLKCLPDCRFEALL